jgi:hypothetical protein
MYDSPSWKRELNRRLAAIRERAGGSLRPPRPVTAVVIRRWATARREGRR